MKKETYLKMTQPFRDNPKLAKSLHICNRILTALVFAAYPLLLMDMFIKRDPALVKAILVPMDGFIAVSVFRYLVNRPRPYENFQIPPVIPKDKKGQSFPSRHVFSAAVIAVTFCMQPAYWIAGSVLLGLAVAIGVIRIISGVHFISDVLAAYVCAIAVCLIGFNVFW